MDIYQVLNEDSGENYSKPEDIREEVETALSELFECGSQAQAVIAKFGSFSAFVDKVVEALTNGSVTIDESWGDGEAFMNIECIGQDMLDGAAFGSRQNEFAKMLGTNPDGTIRRCFGIDL